MSRRMARKAVSASHDSLLDGRVELLQPTSGYRAGLDPVLLAAAVSAEPGARIADLGCGVGAAALCLLARLSSLSIVGLELQPELAKLARENAQLNRVGDKFTVVEGDIREHLDLLEPKSFDQVICNPPYLPAETGRPSPDPLRSLANREDGTTLQDWVDAAFALVRRKGRITFIHRADRLDALLGALTGRAGGVLIYPLWPRHGQAAKRLIVTARREIAGPLQVLPGLVLHAGESFSLEAEAVLRHGGGLDLGESR